MQQDSISQQVWKTQQWPQDWKKSVFIPIPKKGNAKECSNYRTIELISHVIKITLKILQVRDFPGGPVVKNLPCNAGDTGSVPGQGTKIQHAMEQLSPCHN